MKKSVYDASKRGDDADDHCVESLNIKFGIAAKFGTFVVAKFRHKIWMT
jgi:hypothetical protein